MRAIDYQLRERLPLVKKPDQTVADLLLDLATLQIYTRTLERSEAVLELALTYEPARRDVVNQRLQYVRSLIKRRKTEAWGIYYWLWFGVGVIAGALGMRKFSRRRQSIP